MIKYIIERFRPIVRTTDNSDPRLKAVFLKRFMFLNLHRAKLISTISQKLINKRQLAKDFTLESGKKLAVIIPFRNRDAHLKKLLPALRSALTRQSISYHIYIVDQVDQKPFNRAKLINTGFHLSQENHDYFSCHDVDLLPVDAIYDCPSLPLRPTGCIRTSTGERNIANSNLGGILTLRKEHFLAINGMSNNFWHWGKEDDNLLFRLLSQGINPVVDTQGIFDEIDDSSDRFNVVSNNKIQVDKKTAKRMIAANKRYQDKVARGLLPPCAEGLSDLHYELIEKTEEAEDLTRLKVSL